MTDYRVAESIDHVADVLEKIEKHLAKLSKPEVPQVTAKQVRDALRKIAFQTTGEMKDAWFIPDLLKELGLEDK